MHAICYLTQVGSVWAVATVGSIASDRGEFMVLVTEWDALAKDDPAYEAAYVEGPYTAGEEGEEWRRPASAVASAAASGTSASAASAKAARAAGAGAVRVQEQLRGQQAVTALEAAEAERRIWMGDSS